jgi:hypothetical protein
LIAVGKFFYSFADISIAVREIIGLLSEDKLVNFKILEPPKLNHATHAQRLLAVLSKIQDLLAYMIGNNYKPSITKHTLFR